jgi:hypothetical protein
VGGVLVDDDQAVGRFGDDVGLRHLAAGDPEWEVRRLFGQGLGLFGTGGGGEDIGLVAAPEAAGFRDIRSWLGVLAGEEGGERLVLVGLPTPNPSRLREGRKEWCPARRW